MNPYDHNVILCFFVQNDISFIVLEKKGFIPMKIGCFIAGSPRQMQN
jgi:hypothetical protein